MNLAGRDIGCSCHACAFFHTEDQFYKVLMPFIRDGFSAGDRAVHIVDPGKRETHVKKLSDAGIDARGTLETRQLAKDHFLATLSHELRTPLNALVGWLSMLRSPAVMSASGLPKAWSAIDRNAEALVELVEDLLDVSRIATGKIRLAQIELDINEVIQDSVRTIRT